jgi:hypothetical protein
MSRLFVEGGFGMYPTFVFGCALVACALWYATRPRPNAVPLLVALGVLTMCAGALGFVSGVITTCRYYVGNGEHRPALLIEGVGESLTNLALALGLIVLSAFVVSVGAWRFARADAAGATA